MIITIDGLSGQGKSHTGQILAQKVGFEFFSSGKLVRYAAHQIMLSDKGAECADSIVSRMTIEDVLNADTNAMRSNAIIPYFKIVTDSAWRLEHLYEILHEYCAGKDIIIDGRDTFRYFPDADLKYLFISTIEERAKLRMKTTGLGMKECIEHIELRDAVERSIDFPLTELRILHPLQHSLGELLNIMCIDIDEKRR